MNYTDKIESYTTGKMSDLEQLVFEQELAENGTLKEVFEAHQLTEVLLEFTANNLSEAAILGEMPAIETNIFSSPKALYYGASLLALCLLSLFIYKSSTDTTIPLPALEETKQAISTPSTITPPINQATKETIIFQAPIQEVQSVPTPKPSPSKVRTKKLSKPRPVAAIPKKVQTVQLPAKKTSPILAANLSSNKQVNNGEAIVYTAGESITLEPGFVVETGGSFQAFIENKDLDR